MTDLAENGLAAGEKALFLLAEGDTAAVDRDTSTRQARAEIRRWQWRAPGFPPVDLAGVSAVFLFADPMVAAVDQIEELKPWLAAQNAALGRVLTVVDCQLAERQPALQGWFEACIHFSDVVFLSRREGVANKWMSDFINLFKDQFYPCHFIHLKKGGIENPALVLDPQPRRVSHYFDEEEDLAGLEIETDDEEEGEGEEPEVDPYLARMRGGRRVKEVPALKDFLPGG